MNLYFKLLKKPVFSIDDVDKYYGNKNSSRTAIKRLMHDNMVMKIRNNLYTCVSGESNEPVANRFQIASSITKTSYVSHHSAMEYYGVSNQVFYDVYVSSDTIFRDFVFAGYTYRCIVSRNHLGIDHPLYSGGIAVTDLERTVIDCIKDMDKISGLEEVLDIISSLRSLNEEKLLKYMVVYNSRFLYQKAGYLLSENKGAGNLSKEFFEECKAHIGQSKRYLTRDSITGKYVAEWNLVVPMNLYGMKNGDISNGII